MPPKFTCCLLFLSVSINPFLQAQDSDSEDVFEMSPFTVSSSGYSATSSILGTRLQTEIIDHLPGANVVKNELLENLATNSRTSPIILVKPAEAIALEFAISFYDDLEDVRRETLDGYLENIESAIESTSGLRFEASDLTVPRGDRKRTIRKRKAEYTSHARFSIFAEIKEDDSRDIVLETRRIVSDIVEDSDVTRLYHGSVSLVLNNPDQYREELLTAIFQDLDRLKEDLGDEFEILPSGLGNRVFAKPHSQNEVELWIHYEIAFRSIREFTFEQSKLLLKGD